MSIVDLMIPRSEILTILNLSSAEDLDDIQLNAVYMIAEGVLDEQQRAVVVDWAISTMPEVVLRAHFANNTAEAASYLSMMLNGYLKAHYKPH